MRAAGSIALASAGIVATLACGQSGPGGAADVKGPREIKWTFNAGAPIVSLPTVAGGHVAVGASSGTFYLLGRNDGALAWKYDTRQDAEETTFPGDPLVAEDLILIGTQGKTEGHIYAFETATGSVRWKHKVGRPQGEGAPANAPGGVSADLTRLGDAVLATGLDGRLRCLDLMTGDERWGFDGAEPQSGPAAVPGRVFVGGADFKIHALDAASGAPIWETEIEAVVATALTVLDGGIYVGTSPFYVMRLDAESGAITGKSPLQAKPLGRVVASQAALLVFLGSGSEGSDAETVISLDTEPKRIQWGRKAPSGWTSVHPTPWRDVTLLGDRGGELFAYGQADGAKRWSLKFEQPIGAIGVSDD
ncbi:MAG TPA: PQQ-binding-like beta-propeller repeat protein, partial [Candidatus Polarisedimenticolia bacterium]|nr:PQQ-binding-like beta-propeller repeat protein [Candidatus Polarisedimenticolia bacterium]